MARAEDKTFNTIRTLSTKEAADNDGSIVSYGGVFVKKNIECQCTIAARKLIIKRLAKFAGDVVVGGVLLCPNIYTLDDDTIKFKRNVVPHKHRCPILPDEKSSLGTLNEPWEQVYAGNICAESIIVGCLKAKELEACFIPRLAVGKNKYENPTMSIDCDEVNINSNLNIVDPETNVVMMSASNNSFETFVPNYTKWNSFQYTKIIYEPKHVYYINSSNNLIEVNEATCLEIEFDTSIVPNNTKIKFYFTCGDRLKKIPYKLILPRDKKRFIFTSKKPVKSAKIIFVDENIYLI